MTLLVFTGSTRQKSFSRQLARATATMALPGALGGLRSRSHLAPLLLNLQCWLAPLNFALARAAEAFDASGALTNEPAKRHVQAVIDRSCGLPPA